MERLDSFSKILLATGAINYMASSMDGVNGQMKFIPDPDKIHAEGIKYFDDVLAEAVEDLRAVMNKLGDAINNRDALCEIDIRATRAAFEIVCLGKDEVDELYEDDEQGIIEP